LDFAVVFGVTDEAADGAIVTHAEVLGQPFVGDTGAGFDQGGQTAPWIVRELAEAATGKPGPRRIEMDKVGHDLELERIGCPHTRHRN
jgi:hypothetical protein